MNKIEKIILTGYMGSGKSLFGGYFASKTKYTHIDLDDLIIKTQGLSITEIFNKKGEAYFRKLERSNLESLIESNNQEIISLGGGTYCEQDNINLLGQKKNTLVCYLKYSADILFERLKNQSETRPVIASQSDLKSFIHSHLSEREKYYKQADLIIENVSDVERIKIQMDSYLQYKNAY